MEKIRPLLAEVPATLLVPLWARAEEQKRSDPLVRDPRSAEILRALDFDFSRFSYVADCIDSVPEKVRLICAARAAGAPVISCMGAGNRLHADFRVDVIEKTGGCPLARIVRRELKKRGVEKGVKCVVQYIPLDRYDFYKRLGMGNAHCPNADTFFDSMVSFPFQHWLSEDEFTYMLEATRDVLKKIR